MDINVIQFLKLKKITWSNKTTIKTVNKYHKLLSIGHIWGLIGLENHDMVVLK